MNPLGETRRTLCSIRTRERLIDFVAIVFADAQQKARSAALVRVLKMAYDRFALERTPKREIDDDDWMAADAPRLQVNFSRGQQ